MDAEADSYLVDPHGKVVATTSERALGLLGVGYTPAGQSQIEDYKREQAFHAKYGTTGQQLKTFAEAGLSALTLGGSTWAEKALGVNPEDIKGRKEENPNVHLLGTVTGVALPLIATAGGSAGLTAAEEGLNAARLAGTGIEEAEAAVTAAKAAASSGAAGVARFSAPSLIAKAGEITSKGVTGLLRGSLEGSALGRIGAKAIASGAGSSLEGAAYGLGQVVDESALGDPNLTVSKAIEEIGLSALLGGGIGVGTGALGGLIGEAASGAPGAKLGEWMHRFEGNRNLSAAGGGVNVQSLIKKEVQKLGLEGVNQVGREGGEMGLVSALSTPGETLSRSEAAMESAGQKMDAILQGADATPGNAAPSAAKVISRAYNEILKPLEQNPLNASEARSIGDILKAYEDKFGAANPENKFSFKGLHDLRKEVSRKIYGINGNQLISNEFKDALHDFRGIISDEINTGMDATEGFDSAAWKQANREYQVASVFQKFAEKGLTAARGNNIIPLSSMLGAIGGGAIGGPLGALASGAISLGAKRFGSGILGAGARTVRELIDEGAAEGLASKTAESIAAVREAGQATRAGALWNKLGQKVGEPIMGPSKDLARDIAKESLVKNGPEGTPLETVAALSQFERANQRVNNRTTNLVSAVVRAAPKVAAAEAAAGVASHFAKDDEATAKAFDKQAEKIRQYANNPDLLQQKLAQVISDVHEHAPETAQALQVALSRCVATLNQALPPQQPRGPLQTQEPPSPDQVSRFSRCFEAVARPTVILKQAAAGTLTPEAVNAAKSAHPQRFAEIQTAIMEKLASHKGPIPYIQRQQLSLIMGQDLDGTQNPPMIQAAQAAYLAAPRPQAGAGSRPTSKGFGKSTLSHRMLTPLQASSARED